MTKYLDQVRLKVERHPHFAFFRNGKHFFLGCVCLRNVSKPLAVIHCLHAIPVMRYQKLFVVKRQVGLDICA